MDSEKHNSAAGRRRKQPCLTAGWGDHLADRGEIHAVTSLDGLNFNAGVNAGGKHRHRHGKERKLGALHLNGQNRDVKTRQVRVNRSLSVLLT